MIETSIDRVQGDNFCIVFTGEKKFINQLKEFSKLYPNDVKIQYENNDGSIEVKVPYNWLDLLNLQQNETIQKINEKL